MREVLNDCSVNSPTNVIGINEYANKEEKKYHIKSATAIQEIIVTIGVGGDIDAELALKEDSTEEPVFFGADPVVEENDRVFSAIGSFLPFAVGARTGFDTSKIFKEGTYKDEEVVQVDLITFIRNFVSRTFIDDIWIDAEGQEYDMFPMFFRGGELDRNGITLCQINLEVHNPDDEKRKMVQAFILRILEEARYSILRVQQSNDLRVFLFNSANNRCVDKFVEQFFVD